MRVVDMLALLIEKFRSRRIPMRRRASKPLSDRRICPTFIRPAQQYAECEHDQERDTQSKHEQADDGQEFG
jgi:hypothetical protein